MAIIGTEANNTSVSGSGNDTPLATAAKTISSAKVATIRSMAVPGWRDIASFQLDRQREPLRRGRHRSRRSRKVAGSDQRWRCNTNVLKVAVMPRYAIVEGAGIGAFHGNRYLSSIEELHLRQSGSARQFAVINVAANQFGRLCRLW
jgi:hypothetical protein